MNDFFSIERVIKYFPKILSSFPTTLLIVVISMLIGILVGIIIAFIRMNKIPVLYQLSSIFISFNRGTPQIVQLFIVYYGVPLLVESWFGLNINRVDAIYFVLIAYGLNEGAYLSEMFRGALEAIPTGQTEAGLAAGLTKLQTFIRIIVPQAIRIIIPTFAVDLIILFQSTSMAASLGVVDMMGKAGLMSSITKHSIENYTCAGIIFIVISILLDMFFKWVQKKSDYSNARVKEERS